MALAKLDQDPTRLSEIADVLLSIYQCECRTFRYMAHVMLAAQQSHKMKQAIAEMDSSTANVVFDFKQKFLDKGYREGGDSCYGKKGMLWWGAGVYVKPDCEDARFSESLNKLYVEMDFTADIARLQAEMKKDDGGVPAEDGNGVQKDEDVQEGEQDVDVPEGEQDAGAMRMHKQMYKMRIC